MPWDPSDDKAYAARLRHTERREARWKLERDTFALALLGTITDKYPDTVEKLQSQYDKGILTDEEYIEKLWGLRRQP